MPLLSGTRVLACEYGLAGPLCSRLLADLGAEVIKIERPGVGDVTRGWDSIARGESSGFVWMNRGKRSVALDLKDEGSRPALEALIRSSDVFVQNFTPGWPAAHGVDEPAVRAIRPDVVYTEISGYGPDGPYAERNAYDLVVQGETGLISITGTPEEPARVGVSICDVGAGSYAAVATAAALARRAQTGEGARVSVSLFDTMVDWLGYFPHQWWHRKEVPPRTGVRHPHFCPYGPFPAGDGRLFGFAVLSDEHWRAFATEVIDRRDLDADARFASNESRVAHREHLEPELVRAFAVRGADEWLERLQAAGIPCGAVNAIPEVLAHPQLAHNELIVDVESPAGAIPTVGNPFLVGGARPGLGAVPGLGEHTAEVLRELGVEPD
ncbi:MAG TPA: CaiB/BaiF CoA-transferase family protein [Gaiellaceae bacterium]|nr:CaiB/BaiF CoA-transferase family protein [Gaiellaceae bacterium]